MKKIVMSVMAMFFAVALIQAQETRPAENSGDTRIVNPEGARKQDSPPVHTEKYSRDFQQYEENFRSTLKVDDQQLEQIRVLHTETVNRYNTLDPKYLQNNELYRSQVDQLINQRDERLRIILTPEQYSKYNAERDYFMKYDNRYFTNDLEQRRKMASPEMKTAPSDATPSPNPNETRPVAPNPGMEVTPSR